MLDSILSDFFCFCCFRTRYEELIGGSAAAPNSALFDLAEKVEHSCLPNCMYSSKSGKLKYFAIRPIQDCLQSSSYGTLKKVENPPPSGCASFFYSTTFLRLHWSLSDHTDPNDLASHVVVLKHLVHVSVCASSLHTEKVSRRIVLQKFSAKCTFEGASPPATKCPCWLILMNTTKQRRQHVAKSHKCV